MLKKPLFWIVVIIITVVLWFVFAGRGKQQTNTTAITPTATQQDNQFANAAQQNTPNDNTNSTVNNTTTNANSDTTS